MKYVYNEKYPIETEDQLTKAGEYFDKNLSRFHPNERVKVAFSLDQRAMELGVNLDYDWITNYTRMKKTAQISPDFKSSINMRKEACRRHNVKIEMQETDKDCNAILDAIVKKAEDNSPLVIASAITEFDKQAGIEYLYDNEITDPILTVFGSLNNPEFDSIKLAGDATQYDLVRASRDHIKLASIEMSFGKDFAASFKTNPISSLKEMGSLEKTAISSIVKG